MEQKEPRFQHFSDSMMQHLEGNWNGSGACQWCIGARLIPVENAVLTAFRGAVTALPRPAPATDAPPRPRVGKVDASSVDVVTAAVDGSDVGGAAGVAVAVAGLPAPRPRPRVGNEDGTGVAADVACTLGEVAVVDATSFSTVAADPGKLITSPPMLLPLPLPLLIVVPPLCVKFCG